MTVPVALLSPLFEALPLGLRQPVAMVTVHLQLIVDQGLCLVEFLPIGDMWREDKETRTGKAVRGCS